MAEMHSLNFENLIASFIKIYLNPRCDLSNLNIISKKWIFERITIEEETISHSFYLKFLINKKFYSSEFVKMKFLNNLVKSNTNLDESIFNIINSFFKIFYLPTDGINYTNTITDHKVRAIFQLSINNANSKSNDLARKFFIKHLLYNSYLYDDLEFIRFENGKLSLKGLILEEFFLEIKSYNHESIFFNVGIDFCLSIIDFLEKGLLHTKLSHSVINDEFLQNSHYTNFMDIERAKRNFFKVYKYCFSYPCNTNLKFINNLIIFNITNFIPDYKNYINDKLVLEYICDIDSKINNYKFDFEN